MPTTHVQYDQDGPLAYVTINRPEARNAMTWEMYEALVEACDTAEADAAVRILVLRGAGGKAFVAGSDIAQFRTFESPDDGVDYERRLDAILDRVEALDLPTIAQVDGVATGGGCALVAACDLCVCTPDARFGVPIARTLGNCLSATNVARLLDLVGPVHLKDMLFTGRLLSADEAKAVGLVARIAERAAIGDVVRDMAHGIAANAPLTIRATKTMLRRIQEHRRIASADVRDLIVMCYTSADFHEGVDAFLSKRPPSWKGR